MQAHPQPKFRALSPLDRTLTVTFWLAAAVFAAVSVSVSLRIEIDYWDSYNFLLQARRLTDPDFHFVPLEAQRPRALIGLLTLFNWIYTRLAGSYPSLTAYHLLCTVVTLLYVVTWRRVFQKLFDYRLALVASLFLLCCQMLLHYAMMVMTDILSGLLWGLTLLAFLRWWPSLWRVNRNAKLWSTFVLALCGALVGLSKHHLLVLLPAMVGTAFLLTLWRHEARRVFWYFVLCGILYLGFLDGFVRLWGDVNEGFYSLALSIYRQARSSASIQTSKWVFLRNFYLMYGPVFFTWAALGIFLCRRRLITSARRLSLQHGVGLLMLAVVSLLFGGLCQLYPYRETRYLFPFLPTLLALFAWLATRSFESLEGKARTAFGVVVGLSLLWPLYRSYQEVRVFHRDNAFLAGEMGFADFYSELRRPARNGRVCERLEMCWFAVGTQNPVALEHDFYYAGFDVGPQVIYEARLPVTIRPCNQLSESHLETLKQVTQSLSPDTCYAVREQKTAPGKQDSLVLLKPYSFSVTEIQAKQLASMRELSSGFASFRCEKYQGEKYACFETERFFGR